MRSAPMLRRALTGSLLVVMAGTLLTTTPTASADPVPPHAGEKYVALGDSFASGPQIEPMQTKGPAACARSTRNFPSVIASIREGTKFIDATCSGAKLTDLWEAQGEAPPQLQAISRDTTLISFGTLGGNDIGLVGIAANCVVGPNDCTGTPDDSNHQKVEATRANLVRGIRDAKRRAPKATIVMVGYGTYLPPGGCQEVFPGLTADEADYLQGLIDHLSDVIGEVAASKDVLFADQRDIPGAVDHTPCADFADQWIRGIDTGDGTDGAMLHPSTAGMAATASQVTKTLKAATTSARAAMKTVKFNATCKNRSAKKAKLKVRGGKKQVTKVVFRVGKHKVKADKKAPYVVKAKSKKLRKVKGKPKAEVTVRVESLKLTKTFKVKRPGCIKR